MSSGTSNSPALGRAAKLLVLSGAFVCMILLTGVGMVALVTMVGSPTAWQRWSNAGQAFGVLTAVLSGLAVAALVVTFYFQFQELKAQRMELCQQREMLGSAQAALHRSAEAHLRALHGGLTRMAIDDEELAEVWPTYATDLPPTRNRQYLYANLILQHAWLAYRVSDHTEAEMRNNLRFLFTSRHIHEFWLATRAYRSKFLVSGTTESLFDRIANEVFAEIQAERLSMEPERKRRSPPETDSRAA
jgi:hypothetical protein